MTVAATSECVFCRIVANEAPAKVVRAFDYSLIIEPLNPVTEGHVIVIPHEHVRDATEEPDITATVMRAAVIYAKQIGGDCNIITSVGPAATQTVFHLHVHVVSRREGDGLPLPWTPQQEAVRASVGSLPHMRIVR